MNEISCKTQWNGPREGLGDRVLSRVSQTSNIVSVVRNSSNAGASFFHTALAAVISGLVVPILGVLGGSLGVISGVLGLHSGYKAQLRAEKIQDLEGKGLAISDQVIWGGLVVVGAMMTLVFATSLVAMSAAALVIGAALLNVGCAIFYLSFLFDSIYRWVQACQFRSEFKEAIEQGKGLEFLRKQLELSAEEEKLDPVTKENKLTEKLERFIRRTGPEIAEEALKHLAKDPKEEDSQELFTTIRRANYGTRKALIFKMGVSLIGIAATVASAVTPAIAPGCILYAAGAVTWQINDTSALRKLSNRLSKGYYTPTLRDRQEITFRVL